MPRSHDWGILRFIFICFRHKRLIIVEGLRKPNGIKSLPIEYKISIDLDLVLLRWRGDVDINEYRDVFASYLLDQNYRLGRPQLYDFSGLTNLEADFNSIWSILTMVNRQTIGNSLVFQEVIFAPNDTIFGMARMYQSLAENADGVQVHVHRHEVGALAHFRLPHAPFADLHDDASFLAPAPVPVPGVG